MNKKLIAAAVAAAMAPGLANAGGATVYGHGQVEIGSWGGDADGVSVSDEARGRIGVKGSQDVGGGMKALFKAEYKTDFADGDSSGSISLTKRELMVGLKGAFGQVELGRLKQAYKYFGGVKYDPFVASNLEARGNAGMTSGAFGHNSFISDSIGYQIKAGMFSLRLTYDLDDGGGEGVTNATGANAYTLGAKVGSKAWEAGLAIASDDATVEYEATKIFGKFSFAKMHTIHLQLETTEEGTEEHDVLYVNYSAKFGKNSVHVAYGEDDENAALADEEFIRVAFMHKFSKKARVWAGYRETTRDAANSDDSVVSLGMRVDI